MLETLNFSMATYIDTNRLHYLIFNGDAMKFTWYFFDTVVVFLNKFFNITFDIVPEKYI